MTTYYATLLRPGTLWNPDKTVREQAFWNEYRKTVMWFIASAFALLLGLLFAVVEFSFLEST